MKYLVISDLHCGDGSRADDFGQNDKRIIRWINKQKADTVILLGDVYECWQFHMEEIIWAHEELYNEFQKPKYIRITGNHDYNLIYPLTYKITLGNGKTVWLEHGFRNDRSMTSPITRFGVWLYGKTIEQVLPDSDNFFARKNDKSEIQKNTLALADTMGDLYDHVICGHTHEHEQQTRMSIRHRQYRYYNAGTCQNGKFQGVFIESERSKIILI